MKLLLTTTCLLLYNLLPSSAQDNRDVFAEGKAQYQRGAYYEAYQRFSAAYTLSKNMGDAAYQDLSRTWLQKSAAGIQAEQQRTDSLLQATRKLTDAFYFYEDRLALAYKGGEFGFINKRGEVVIDYQYSSATNFDEATGYAQVEKGDYDFNKKRYWLAPNGMEHPYTIAVEDLPTITANGESSFKKEAKDTAPQNTLEVFRISGSKDYYQELHDGIDRYQQGDYFASFQRFNAANVLAENDNNDRIADLGSQLRDSAVQRIRLLAVQSANALEVAQNIREAFYFYDGKYALASGEKKGKKVFYYIDKNGKELKKLGYWAKAEQFDNSGLAKVVDGEKTNYLLDDSGRTYKVVYRIKSLEPRATALDLRRNRLDHIPEAIFDNSQLQILLLSSNFITKLPSEIGQLTNLIQLDLKHNNLSNLPVEIGQLTNLTMLNLGENDLSSLPPEIGQLTNLVELNIRDNPRFEFKAICTAFRSFPRSIRISSGTHISNEDSKALLIWIEKPQSIPPQIGQLTNLTGLHLQENSLKSLPPEIGQLKRLTQMDLQDNQLTSLPYDIWQLINLTELNLSGNNLSQLSPEIGQLRNLTMLDLGDNYMESLPSEIGQLKNLTMLDLEGNRLESLPSEIGQLKNLTELDLCHNRLTSLPYDIWQLINLTELNLSANNLLQLPPEIGQLNNLADLDLYANELSRLPSEIGQLTNLSVLDLSDNDLSQLPPEIGQLNNLTTLNLRGNRRLEFKDFCTVFSSFSRGIRIAITYDGNNEDSDVILVKIDPLWSLPPEIGQLTNLTRLYFQNNELTSLPPEIGQLINLTELNFRGNDLSRLPSEIGQLTNLTKLDLSSNDLRRLPPEIAQLTKLTHIDLHDNLLFGIPIQIASLNKLVEMNLSDNYLPSLPPEIGQLINLTKLDLSSNDLRRLPPEIAQLTKLTHIDLHDNQLVGIPIQIASLNKLVEMNLSDNYLSNLPPEIGQLVNLAELNLSNTLISPPEYKKVKKLLPNCNIEYDSTSLDLRGISSLPPEIGQLTSLTELDLEFNDLTSLPPEIGRLTNLNTLELGNNPKLEFKTVCTAFASYPRKIRISTRGYISNDNINELIITIDEQKSLPSEVGQLNNLIELGLSGSDLKSLPPEIGQLTKLNELDLSWNELTSLPPEIGQLTNLNELDLSWNELTSLPPEIIQLVNLTKLDLGGNELSSLPPEITQLANLTTLDLGGNELTSLPPEITQLTNLTKLILRRNNFHWTERTRIRELLPNCEIKFYPL